MPRSPGLVLVYAQCPDFNHAVSAALTRQGFDVLHVASRESIVRVIREEGPAVALLHWDSLGRAALRLACFLKSGPLKRHAQVALVAGSDGSAPGRLAALASGVDDLIECASDSETLVARVRGLLRSHPQLAGATSHVS